MIIGKEKVVAVDYHLSSKNPETGVLELVEKTSVEEPFVFLSGTGAVLDDFEKNLAGLKVGDSFDFVITSENGYGKVEADYLVSIPVDAFKGEDGELDLEMIKVGNMLPMMDSEGNRLQGVVKEIAKDTIKMDFNHPLAGQDLHFKGKVLEVREATSEELDHGHVHGAGGHHH
ncbi:MAG: FKBP-type peptidyl-prolyl cis-trans isomerase [Bacteroidota bacterium]|jgi:FKBP-type peptidyl-prolyl cis-trans isomerase SlyD